MLVARTIYKCPFCEAKYSTTSTNKSVKYNAKKSLYVHMEETHKDELRGLPAAQVYFNHKYNKTGGQCVIDKKETAWNNDSERYERFCSEECKKKYREEFKRRMKAAGKEDQMNDPEHQKKMLANRRISGIYVWSKDPSYKFQYTGKLELAWLEFLDKIYGWENPKDIFMPAPQIFHYKDEDGKERFYIPDCYLASIDLIVEIKGSNYDETGDPNSNKHEWRRREAKKEKIKDEILLKSKHNYVKIVDNNFTPFIDFMNGIVSET